MMMYPAAAAASYMDPRSAYDMMMIPSHMNKMDLTSSSPNPPLLYHHHSSPYNPASSYPYSVPHGRSGCCNHTPPPYYGYGACPYTYTHCPPPPPFHFHALYNPPFPQQHYFVEQPRYNYEKYNNHHHHCCGCKHLQEEDDKKPRSKEESKVLDADNKPLLLKDRPNYPIMWLPEPKPNEEKHYSHDPVSVKHPHPEPSKKGADGGDANPFPFQIVWLPSKSDQMEVGKETKEHNLDMEAKKGLPDEETTETNEGECKSHTSKCATAQKVIPVKQVEEKNNPKNTVNSDSDDKGMIKASPKTSKLPPVCLRIDPLPRKKKSSRSPSPPAEKERSKSNVSNPKSSTEHQAQVLKKTKEEQGEGDTKTVDHANVQRGQRNESEKGKIEEKKNMSEHEAALIIQSVYRGFEVRKSQPLKKLRQINEVKKQIFELSNRIQDLETSSTIGLDSKKQVIIGETIMSLLLKLDTIQGLHPFVREVRKSVAKELVGLQEKLDSLAFVKSETPSEVMHPEYDAIQGKLDQAQAQMSACWNDQHRATESQNDDNDIADESSSIEQQLEKSEDDAIQDKFDHAPTESDTVICENQKVEATELQLESRKKNFHQAPTECDEAQGLCKNNEVEAIEPHDDCNVIVESQLGSHKEKFDQAPTERDELCENNEVKATGLQEGCNTIGEPQLESHKDQALTEGDEGQGLCDNHKVENAEEGCNTVGEPQLESHRDQAPTEGDEAPRLCDNHEVEAADEGGDTIGESQKEKLDQATSECDEGLGLCENHEVEATDNGDVESDDMKFEDDTRELNKKQLETAAVNVESMMCDGEADVVESGDHVQMDAEIKGAAPKANGGDGGLMEENEKLRAAVEELMKAGNEQLGVIRELTGRVKDLEKKLSKKTKKKVKVNKRGRSRNIVVV